MPPITPGTISLEEMRFLIARPDPVILEIGCNDGTDTQRMLETFPQARIYCFEPDPRALARFAVKDSRVMLVPMAIGSYDGTAKFYPSQGLPSPLPAPEAAAVAARLPHGWDLSGSLRRPKLHLREHPWCQFGEPIKVPVIRLDTWAATMSNERIDFIWADVQGAEIDLIQGGQDTLRRCTRFFYTEYNQRELYEGQVNLDRILELLPEYDVVTQYSEDVLLRRR
jgi:FkbM family methyltransferase